MESQYNKRKVRVMKLGRLLLLAPLFALTSCGNLANFYKDVVEGHTPESTAFNVSGHYYTFYDLVPNDFEDYQDLKASFNNSSISFVDDYSVTFNSGNSEQSGRYNQYDTLVVIVITSSDGQAIPEDQQVPEIFVLNDTDLHYSFEHNNVSIEAVYALDE